MTTDLVLRSTDEAFSLAERICRSGLVPQAYRGKPIETAVALLYGAEMGLPPMTTLQRVVVINGKPTLDAQGLDSLIRSAGHSLTGDANADGAKVTGKRCDNGDSMTVEFGPEDAKRAQLKNDTYGKFPGDMYWARCVSQLGRRLFADVLLGVSYTPEEYQAVVDQNEWSGKQTENGNGAPDRPDVDVAAYTSPATRTVRQPPGSTPIAADEATGEIIVDAEVVEESAPAVAKKAQKDNMHRLFGLKGLTDRDERLAYTVQIVGRALASSNDLTEAEANMLISQLRLDVGETAPVREEVGA